LVFWKAFSKHDLMKAILDIFKPKMWEILNFQFFFVIGINFTKLQNMVLKGKFI
jgi:hypothetical protein